MKTIEIFKNNLLREIAKLEQSLMDVPKELTKHMGEGFLHPQRFFDHCVRESKIETLKTLLGQTEKGFDMAHFVECATGFGAAHPTASTVGWMQAQCFALEAWQDAQGRGEKSPEDLQRGVANAKKALEDAKLEWKKHFAKWQLAVGEDWNSLKEGVIDFLESEGVELDVERDGDHCEWWVTTTHEQKQFIQNELLRLFGDSVLK